MLSQGDPAWADDLVSIITPAYRAAGVIGETIQSVIDQTYPRWEMLIADDCSPDDTRAVVEQWCARDTRIRLIPMATNGGPAMARNAALAAASGRWVAFLDSDDMWLAEKLEHQLAFARTDDAALTFTGFRRISADSARTGRYIHVPATLNYRQLLANTAIATSTVMVDRQRTGAFTMRKTYYDDFACWLSLLRNGGHAAGLDQDLMRYRVMAASVSRNKRVSAKQVWLAYRNIEQLSMIASISAFVRYGLRGALKYGRF